MYFVIIGFFLGVVRAMMGILMIMSIGPVNLFRRIFHVKKPWTMFGQAGQIYGVCVH